MVKTYVGNYGTEIRLDIDPPPRLDAEGNERDPISLDAASAFKIKVLKPSGAVVEWVAAKYTDPDPTVDNTKITYTTQDGDIDEIGRYKLHAVVEWATPVAAQLYGELVKLKVYEVWK